MHYVVFLPQGKAGGSLVGNGDDNNDGAGSPLFTFVDESIFKKETFLGKCPLSLTLSLFLFLTSIKLKHKNIALLILVSYVIGFVLLVVFPNSMLGMLNE